MTHAFVARGDARAGRRLIVSSMAGQPAMQPFVAYAVARSC